MSNLLKSDNFGQRIYDRFPMKYREDDIDQNYALKRYLQVMGDGGFQFAIEDINGLTTLIDPDTIKAEFLPLLFRHYGLEVFNGIPEEYLRYLLPRLGEIYAMKGSLQAIDYVCTSISGIKTITTVDYDENGNPTVKVKLEMDVALGDFVPDVEQLNRILEKFVPFYCDLLTIYSYLFYETGDLETAEKDFLHILDVKNEKALIPYAKGTRYAPTLTDSIGNHLLNSTFKLNEGVYYDIDPDYTVDVVSSQYKESGVFNKSKSTQYYRGKTNLYPEVSITDTPSSYENKNTVVLNDTIETDEVKDIISVIPLEDKSPLKSSDKETQTVTLLDFEWTKTTNGLLLNSTFITNSHDNSGHFSAEDSQREHLVTLYDERGVIDREKSSEYYQGLLNVFGLLLNDSFILNGGVDVDQTSQESFMLADRGVLKDDDREKQVAVLNAFKYYASLNSGMTLNKDLYTNEANNERGLASSVEKDLYTMEQTVNEKCSLSSNQDCDTGFFLNSTHCSLNNSLVGAPSIYDKIIQNGTIRYIYPMSFGVMSA